MSPRGSAARLAVGLLLVVASACGGDGDGSRPDISLSTTLTTNGSTTTEASGTTEPDATTTTSPDDGSTTTEPVTTSTTVATTTSRAESLTTTTAASSGTTAEATDQAAAPPVDSSPDDDDASWWWIAILLLAALIAFLVWRRSRTTTPWPDRATQLANDIDVAGQSVLLGPELTEDLWTTALARSNEIRAGADDLLDHSPSTAARQAVSEAVDALRHAEIQATAARSGVGGAGDRDAAAAELSAAVQRLRAVAMPAPTTQS